MSLAQVEQETITFRKPTTADGAAVYDLVKHCPPLDTNSMYCNLLQTTHFSDTCVAADMSGELVGFVSAYLIPHSPETLFIWQVAVGEKARGQGLASRMLTEILSRDMCRQVNYIETTITPDNAASWALFNRLAKTLNTSIEKTVMFDRYTDFADQHDTEMLAKLGPFSL